MLFGKREREVKLELLLLLYVRYQSSASRKQFYWRCKQVDPLILLSKLELHSMVTKHYRL